MIKYFKSLIRAELIEPLKTKKPEFLKNIKSFKRYSFGEKNKKIKFYVIKRNYNFNGLFSNLIFVIDHIKYAKEKKMIPIIDMENFVTVYNENNKINKSLNAWTYYFKQVSQYNLEEVYKSKNVYFSNDRRIYKKEINEDKSLLKIYKKYIHINYDHMKYFKKLKKKIFYNKGKILGIHIRGGMEKVVRGHSFPPRPEDILKELGRYTANYKFATLNTDDKNALKSLANSKDVEYNQRNRAIYNDIASWYKSISPEDEWEANTKQYIEDHYEVYNGNLYSDLVQS